MSIDKRLFIWLFIAFIVATIIGTLTHEFGHYIVAKCLGYEASIHYDYTHLGSSSPNQIIKHADSFWILVGGPLETMLTGTIGFVLLFLFRKSFENATKLSCRQWFLIFLSLFWLRQTANLVTGIGGYFCQGKFSQGGDEIRLARWAHLPTWSIETLTAIIGAIVLTIIIFKFVPIKQRLTFIASGLAGGLTGYILWIVLVGKYLMP